MYTRTNEADDEAFKLVNNCEVSATPLDVYHHLSLALAMIDAPNGADRVMSQTDYNMLYDVYCRLGSKLDKKQRAADRLSRSTPSN